MANNKVTLKISNYSKVLGKFDDLRDSFEDLTKVNKKAAITIQSWVLRNFQQEGKLHERGSFAWKALSPVTVMLRKNGGDKPLQDTGHLRNSFVPTAGKTFAKVTSRVNYSNLHEEGGFSMFRGKRVKVPQRKMLPTETQAVKIVDPVYKKYIQDIERST